MNPHAIQELLSDIRPYLERLLEVEPDEARQEKTETILDELDEMLVQVKRSLR